MSRVARAAAAVLAVAAYALPMSMGLLTNVVHDAYHLREYLEHGSMQVADVHEPRPGEFVHAHGGAEHSHGATTDALLGAADRTDQPDEEHHVPTLELVGHLPAQVAIEAILGPQGDAGDVQLALALPRSPTPPPLPPPRA